MNIYQDVETLHFILQFLDGRLPLNTPGDIIAKHVSLGGSDSRRPVHPVTSVADEKWVHCDGGAAVKGITIPDLRGKLPLGASTTYAFDSVGGSATADIAHTHTNPNTSSTGSHSHTNPDTSSHLGHDHALPSATAGESAHTHSNPTTSAPSATVTVSQSQSDIIVSSSAHTHTQADTGAGSSHAHNIGGTVTSAGAHTHTQADTSSQANHSHTQAATDSAGSSTQSVLNPYLATRYFIYVGV